jgi:hypothetical protein
VASYQCVRVLGVRGASLTGCHFSLQLVDNRWGSVSFGDLGDNTASCERASVFPLRERELTSPQINVIHPPSRLGDCTHIPLIFGSLIVSNLLQSIGTIFNTRWVSLRGVFPETLCSVQGASALATSRPLVTLFQAVSSKPETSVRLSGENRASTMTWPLTCLFSRSFALALHAFFLLFMRMRVTARSKWFTLVLGWALVVFVVSIGPLAIQKKDLGPYFGPSGFWYVAHCMCRSTPLLIHKEGAGSQSSIRPPGLFWNTCL